MTPTREELVESTVNAFRVWHANSLLRLDYWAEGKWIPRPESNFGKALSAGIFYRVRPAPEKRLRPYNLQEMLPLVGTAVKCKNRSHPLHRLIATVCQGDGGDFVVEFANGESRNSPRYLLDNWEHLDGSPLGVEEETNAD